MDFVKTEEEIKIMKNAGRILGKALAELKKMIKPGLDCMELEEKFLEICEEKDVTPACKGYAPSSMPPFPTGLCVSINDQSVHCYPKKGIILKDGDVITVDTVIEKEGLNVDAAFSMVAGNNKDPLKQKLVDVAAKSLMESASQVKHGARIGRISHKMQKIVESSGLNVLKDYAGHGIGRDMHEYPEIPCYGSKNDGPRLTAGMTICIEALVCTGKERVLNDSVWETRMADGGFFAQSEHTILVTRNGYEILTLPDKDK